MLIIVFGFEDEDYTSGPKPTNPTMWSKIKKKRLRMIRHNYTVTVL
jgi:hypothetical protein